MCATFYKKAPVSEVILGVTFKINVLDLDLICKFRDFQKDDYPKIEILPPLASEYLQENKIINEIDINSSGPVLFRIRTVDGHWLIQVQGNKLYLNWVRHDEEEVGKYPGFDNILDRFLRNLEDITKLANKNFNQHVSSYDLTYHDRIEWQKHISSLTQLNQIIKFMPPQINQEFNNVISTFSFPCSDISGFGILRINTSSSIKNTQLLRFESVLKGFNKDVDIRQWFDSAHNLQLKFFREVFQKDILEDWQ